MEGWSFGRVAPRGATPFWGDCLAAADNGTPRFERKTDEASRRGFTCTRSQTPRLQTAFTSFCESDRSSPNDHGRGGANDGCFLLFRDFGSGPAVRWSEKASLTAASGRKEGRPPTDGRSECMVGRLKRPSFRTHQQISLFSVKSAASGGL